MKDESGGDRSLGNESIEPEEAEVINATEEPQGARDILGVTDDDEEEKPKMDLHLSYQGFSIFGRCLCVVVEPWPSSSAPRSRTPGEVDGDMAPPQPPQTVAISSRIREETPLFLSDFDHPEEEFHSMTALRQIGPSRSENRLEDQEEVSGMMQLTQLLQTSAMYRIDSDSDGEGAGVFMGDPEASRDIF